jgi:hypothetical protein
MNYNEFVCECAMRVGAVISPETGKFSLSPRGCLSRALDLAESLVKEGFISPTLELLGKKFEVYSDALERGYTERRREQISQIGTIPSIDPEKREELYKRRYDEDPKVRKAARDALDQREDMLTLSLSPEVLEAIKLSIEPKNDFYTIANLLLPELSEQARRLEARKRGEGVSISPAVEHFLEFLDFGNEEEDEDTIDTEQELLDNLDRHKESNHYAKQIYETFVANSKAEQCVKEELGEVRKTARADAKQNKPPRTNTRPKKSASLKSENVRDQAPVQ